MDNAAVVLVYKEKEGRKCFIKRSTQHILILDYTALDI